MRSYLDHNATTPLRPEVCEAMIEALRDGFGNPSSTHEEGAHARLAVDRARARVASCLGAEPDAVVFTSGATEANSTVLRGLLGPGDHIVTTTVEHPSVDAPLERLASRGLRVTRLSVDEEGLVDADALKTVLEDDTRLVSVIWANNETGVVQPVADICAVAHERGVAVHVDATQAVGKWPVDVTQVPVDFLASSAHKLNGPKGTGCLYVRDRSVVPLLEGGGQERGRRGGTENVAGIVGFGVACELAERELEARMASYAALRDRMWQGIRARVSDVRRNGSSVHVLPNTLNVEICGIAGELLLQSLDLAGVAVSAGAACHSGKVSPSHVLVAMGRSAEEARGALRLSVGFGVTEAQVDAFVDLLEDLVRRARAVATP